MKRFFVAISALTLLVCIFTAVPRGAELKDPKEIIKKSQDYALSIDSYSYTVYGEGWDMNPADNAKRTSAAAGEAQKFGRVAGVAGDIKEDAEKNKDAEKPVYKRYKCEYKFKKPYLLQMKVIKSDYVPQIVFGSLLTYRPDNDPKVWWFKPRISPIAIKRDIASESGDLLYSVIALNYAMMDAMSKDTAPVFKGEGKMAGRDSYMIEFKFDKDKKLKPHGVDFKKFGIPKEAQDQFEKEVNGYTDGKTGRIVFYFDKETLLVVGRESFDPDDKKLGLKQWKEIKVNNLTEKDF
jgi:hypothetical protein